MFHVRTGQPGAEASGSPPCKPGKRHKKRTSEDVLLQLSWPGSPCLRRQGSTVSPPAVRRSPYSYRSASAGIRSQ